MVGVCHLHLSTCACPAVAPIAYFVLEVDGRLVENHWRTICGPIAVAQCLNLVNEIQRLRRVREALDKVLQERGLPPLRVPLSKVRVAELVPFVCHELGACPFQNFAARLKQDGACQNRRLLLQLWFVTRTPGPIPGLPKTCIGHILTCWPPSRATTCM